MDISRLDRKVGPIYNELIIDSINDYLHAEPLNLPATERTNWKIENPKIDSRDYSDEEFQDLILESHRQPLNPISLAREALGYDETATEQEIADGLRAEYTRILAEYEENGVDSSALSTAWEIIHLTEAYVAGYSEEIGALAVKLLSIKPSYKPTVKPLNGLYRWNKKIWVPDEDMHDKIEAYLLSSVGMINQEEFYRKHIRHMKIGNHVDLDSFIETNAFVALQEDATVITYENASKIYGPVFGYILAKIAANEAQHKRAYKGIHLGLLQYFPDQVVLATHSTANNFEMPGFEGIEGYEKSAQKLGFVGLLDPAGIEKSQQQLIKSMKLEEVTLKSRAAKEARDELLQGTNKGSIDRKKDAVRLERIREKTILRAVKAGTTLPLVIGQTVTANVRNKELEFPLAA